MRLRLQRMVKPGKDELQRKAARWRTSVVGRPQTSEGYCSHYVIFKKAQLDNRVIAVLIGCKEKSVSKRDVVRHCSKRVAFRAEGWKWTWPRDTSNVKVYASSLAGLNILSQFGCSVSGSDLD